MCVDQLIKLNAKLQQARSFHVVHMRHLKRENDHPDDGVGPWQIRFADAARYVLATRDEAITLAKDIRDRIDPIVEKYRQRVKSILIAQIEAYNWKSIDESVTWLGAMDPDPVVLVSEAADRTIVGLDAGWVLYVPEVDTHHVKSLVAALQEALDQSMYPYLMQHAAEMKRLLA